MLNVLVVKERQPGEARVAATPESVKRLIREGLQVCVEAGAGAGAFFSDDDYRAAGAQVGGRTEGLWNAADLVLKVGPLVLHPDVALHEAELPKPGAVVIGMLAPHQNLEAVRHLAERRVTALALELVPRVTQAQSMDALSSQASIAGYKAVVIAAGRLGKYFPLLMTAAGTVPPARVLVLGAGVAGLQAVATAKRLGAVVAAADIRHGVKEEVESVGGRFIEMPAPPSAGEPSRGASGTYAAEVSREFLAHQHNALKPHVAAADVVITTAQVPGRPAPRLLTADMVQAMSAGSVVVDLAIEQGGNCELSQAGTETVHHGVLILAPRNLPATMPVAASTLYARNVLELVRRIVRDGQIHLDPADQILSKVLLTHQGEVRHAPIAALLSRGAA